MEPKPFRITFTPRINPQRAAPMTIRAMVELYGAEFLDVPLVAYVSDGNRNSEAIPLMEDYYNRSGAMDNGDGTTYRGRIMIPASLREKRLVSAERKVKVRDEQRPVREFDPPTATPPTTETTGA